MAKPTKMTTTRTGRVSDLVFSDVSFAVKDKKILKDCFGTFKAGEITAIMGGSGGGKSTLLNLLSARQKWTREQEQSLNVRFSSATTTSTPRHLRERLSPTTLKNLSSYVMQDDSLLPTDTVFESILFSARMRLPQLTRGQAEAKTAKLVDQLGLIDAKDVFVGSSLIKGISGGQRKRTSVGVEMVTDPQLCFLDEPTSGLDSGSAMRLVTFLKQYARETNAVIVCTIHQPSPTLFTMFDRVLLLKKGEVLLQGPMKMSTAAGAGAASAGVGAAAVDLHGDEELLAALDVEEGGPIGLPTTTSQNQEDLQPLAQHSAAEGLLEVEKPLFQQLKECNHPVPRGFSTADWLIELAETLDAEETMRMVAYAKREFEKSLLKNKTILAAEEVGHDLLSDDGDEDEPSHSVMMGSSYKKNQLLLSGDKKMNNQQGGRALERGSRANLFVQYGTLVARELRRSYRDTGELMTRAFSLMPIPVLLLLFWWYFRTNRLEHSLPPPPSTVDNMEHILDMLDANTGDNPGFMVFFQSRISFVINILIAASFTAALPAVTMFPAEKPMFVREYTAGMYNVAAYLLAKFTVELPFLLVILFYVCGVLYGAVGFFVHFWAAALVSGLLSLCLMSLALVIGAGVHSVAEGVELLTLLVLLMLLTAGLFFPTVFQLRGLVFLQYIFPIKFAANVMLRGEVDGLLASDAWGEWKRQWEGRMGSARRIFANMETPAQGLERFGEGLKTAQGQMLQVLAVLLPIAGPGAGAKELARVHESLTEGAKALAVNQQEFQLVKAAYTKQKEVALKAIDLPTAYENSLEDYLKDQKVERTGDNLLAWDVLWLILPFLFFRCVAGLLLHLQSRYTVA